MEITFFGNGQRGLICLQTLLDKGYEINTIVVHPEKREQWLEQAESNGIKLISPDDPNEASVVEYLRSLSSEVFVLAGYGKILKQPIIDVPSRMCVNLHGGRLPQYRGSSPMNWALINGDSSYTLSVIKVAPGVDTGDVLVDRTFPIEPEHTIVDLHKNANQAFPEMLVEVLQKIQADSLSPRIQDQSESSYYPLRFPDDGTIIWDMYTAEEIHNRIRALTEPYPCAVTYFKGEPLKLIASEMTARPFYGEPGRIYQITDKGMLVAARDRCLWISSAKNQDGSVFVRAQRYEKFITLREQAVARHVMEEKS